MVGWLISTFVAAENQVRDGVKILQSEGYSYINLPFSKFNDYQLNIINEKYILFSSGLVTNLNEFFPQKTLDDILLSLIADKSYSALKQLRGPLCGCMVDKQNGSITAFTNHLGDRPVYYYINQEGFIISSNLYLLSQFLSACHINLSLDDIACATFLEYGFQIDDLTLLHKVKRLWPGTVLSIDINNNAETISYYKMSNVVETKLSIDEIIDKMDALFCRAIQRSFSLDTLLGYNHLADLSGGLDSRVLAFAAHKLGYHNIQNISYGVPLCFDNIISMKIARDLGNSYFFYDISNLKFIFDLEDAVKRNFGCAVYFGPTGSLPFMKFIDTTKFGIRHNGNIGDSILGGYLTSTNQKSVGDLSGANYSKFKWRKETIDFSRFENEEIQNLYSRYLFADPASHFLIQEEMVAISPFMDIDFLDFILSIPAKYRYNKKIYYAWLHKKYPNAQRKYPYNSFLFKPKGNYLIKYYISGGIRRLLNTCKLVSYKIGISKYQYRLTGMNPLNALIERNQEAIAFISKYFQDTINLIQNDEIKKMLVTQYKSNNYVDKLMVINLLAFNKLYIS